MIRLPEAETEQPDPRTPEDDRFWCGFIAGAGTILFFVAIAMGLSPST